LSNNISRVVLAASRFSFSSSVRIVGVQFNARSRLNVSVSKVGPASSTSVAGGITINDLFHRKTNQLVSSGDDVVGFDGFSRRESPSRSTLSLVVDRSADSRASLDEPIPGGWVWSVKLALGEFGLHRSV